MLEAIKKKSKGWISYLIIALITIPFAMFGIQSYFGKPIIATVDGEDIDAIQYNRLYSEYSIRLQQELGENYNDKELKLAVINSLIENILLDNFAKDRGIITVTEEVLLAISSNNEFYIDGVFSNELYKAKLRGASPAEYELNQQQILTREQIRRNLLESKFTTDVQIAQLTNLSNQQRELSYIVIKDDEFIEQVEINENEITEYYENNKEQFLEPLRIKVNFVELVKNEITITNDFTNDDLLSIYDEQIDRFIEPEERRAQHILLDDEDLANSTLKEIKQGKDFAKIAKLKSIDSATKEKAGDLGYFKSGDMVAEFNDAVFSMSIDDIKLVKSAYGYHIIKLNDIIEKHNKTFTDVKSELEDIYIKKEKDKEFNILQEEFANSAYEKTIQELAEDFSLDVQFSDFFTDNSDIYDPIFINAAYSDLVLNGENSDVLEIGDNLIVISLMDSIQQKQKTLAESRDEIDNILRKTKVMTFIDDLSAKLIISLTKDDEYASNFISSNNFKWSDSVWVNRNSDMPFSIAKITYKIPKPKADEDVYVAQRFDYNNTLLLKLTGIRQVVEEDNNKEISQLYLIQEFNEWFKSFVDSLRNEADIEIFENLL